jgi:glycosyltransferase involved in cell wall biosynthesis
VVSLTHAAISEMQNFDYLRDGKMPPFTVIPTCANLNRFTVSAVERRDFTLGYVGSVGVWYLFDETLRCFQLIREKIPAARMHILNRGGHDFIKSRLNAMSISPDLIRLESGDHDQVARAMQSMNAGIFFYRPAYSKIATAPTKLGEFLGCGIPCLSNYGVGDMAEILEGDNVGVAVTDFDNATLKEAVNRLVALSQMSGIAEKCRSTAERHFSLEEGVARYARIYQSLDVG